MRTGRKEEVYSALNPTVDKSMTLVYKYQFFVQDAIMSW